MSYKSDFLLLFFMKNIFAVSGVLRSVLVCAPHHVRQHRVCRWVAEVLFLLFRNS